MTHKKYFRFWYITNHLYSIFTLHIGSMLTFFLVALETKKLLIHLLLNCHLLLNFSRKKVFLLFRFDVCKTSVKGSYFSKIAGFFPTTFASINTVTGISQGFFLDFKQFSIVCNVSRSIPTTDSVDFKIFSVIKQSFRCSD